MICTTMRIRPVRHEALVALSEQMEIGAHLLTIVDKYAKHCSLAVLVPAAGEFTHTMRAASTVDSLRAKHSHMLDTVTRECLLTDDALVVAVDGLLDEAVQFAYRISALQQHGSSVEQVIEQTPMVIGGRVRGPAVASLADVMRRCVAHLHAMVAGMVRLPTTVTRIDRRSTPTYGDDSATINARVRSMNVRPVACAHESFVNRWVSCIAVTFMLCSITKDFIEPLTLRLSKMPADRV